MVRRTPGITRRGVRLALAVCAALITLTACAPASGAPHDDDGVVLRYADYTSAKSGGPFRKFAADVTARTNGRITFKEYWGGALLTGTDMASGVRGGVADLGMFTATYYPSEFPVTNWLTNLGNLADTAQPTGVLQANAAQAEFVMSNQQVNAQFENRGMKLLFSSHPITNYDIICTSPVTTLEQAAGKRIRTGGEIWDAEVRALGMVPVNLPIGETYEGLQRGVIDCSLASPKTVTAYGLWEVAHNYTRLPLSGINAQYVVMNREVWESLSTEDKRAVWDASYLWWEGYLEYEGLNLAKVLAQKGPAEHGMRFLEADERMTAAIREHQERARGTLASTAPPQLAQPQAVIDQYRATMDSWHQRITDAHIVGPNGEVNMNEYARLVRTEVFDRYRP